CDDPNLLGFVRAARIVLATCRKVPSPGDFEPRTDGFLLLGADLSGETSRRKDDVLLRLYVVPAVAEVAAALEDQAVAEDLPRRLVGQRDRAVRGGLHAQMLVLQPVVANLHAGMNIPCCRSSYNMIGRIAECGRGGEKAYLPAFAMLADRNVVRRLLQ